jgi:two-component system, chemotaxis family, chemotaxis protein CheY
MTSLTAASVAQNPTPSEAGPSILVVDDDVVHRMVICRVAAKVGYVPIEASSYEEAEPLLSSRAFDCISLDLSLGKRGGIDVLNLIAEHAKQSPVIIISGSDLDLRAEATSIARRLGLNSYDPLPKPVNLAELKQRLTNIKLRTDAGLKAAI